MWTRNKHKHSARRPHLQQGRSTPHTSCRKDKKVNQMNLAEVQKKIDFLKGRNEYNKNNKYANDLTDRFLFLLNKNE